MFMIIMMTVDVHLKCVHYGLGLGLDTAGLDYIPAIICLNCE